MKPQARRPWVPQDIEQFSQELAEQIAAYDADGIETEIDLLIEQNLEIHDRACVNLNPATNVMNPKAEAALARGLGSRPSLGYPGDKYEMGLEAIERIELIAANLVCDVFAADFAEIRVASGAMANLYAFMATCRPGDPIIVPPPEIGGHVTHRDEGAAGLYGLEIHPAPIDANAYTVDVDALRALARRIRPKLISIGGSLNLFSHPVAEIRAVADEVGAVVLFDAAHQCGLFAGRAWPNPLTEGAHLMTFSTYKSLGGPPSGLIVTNEATLAERLDKIAYPGLTANFDVAKSASLAIALLDWQVHGAAYAAKMIETAQALATSLAAADLPVYAAERGFTNSHQFAIEAQRFGGGQTMAKLLRTANVLTCGIGLPLEPVAGDLNGLRFGTPEVVRWGMDTQEMSELAGFIARVLIGGESPEKVAKDVTAFRTRFQSLHYIR